MKFVAMSFAPLLDASLAIRLHAVPAIAALGLGAVQLMLPKGGRRHRVLGWAWVTLMVVIAGSSFFIHTICNLGVFSPIHLLSILTLVSLPFAVGHARQRRIANHARTMKILFFASLVLAGVFTFTPGRIMYDIATGSQSAVGTCAP